MAADHVKNNIQEAIKAFAKENLSENAPKLFQTLGYNTDRQVPLPPLNVRFFPNQVRLYTAFRPVK